MSPVIPSILTAQIRFHVSLQVGVLNGVPEPTNPEKNLGKTENPQILHHQIFTHCQSNIKCKTLRTTLYNSNTKPELKKLQNPEILMFLEKNLKAVWPKIAKLDTRKILQNKL